MVLPENVVQALSRLENAGWESYAVGATIALVNKEKTFAFAHTMSPDPQSHTDEW